MAAYQPLARLGYMDYSVVREVFAMDRPDGDLASYESSKKVRRAAE